MRYEDAVVVGIAELEIDRRVPLWADVDAHRIAAEQVLDRALGDLDTRTATASWPVTSG